MVFDSLFFKILFMKNESSMSFLSSYSKLLMPNTFILFFAGDDYSFSKY